jgi:putative GTP pyrophosphokinase
MGFSTLKYSRSKVNKAGKTLVGLLSSDVGKKTEDREFLRALSILNNWRSCHGYPINTFQATLRTKLKSIDPKALVAQRLKRLPSIVLKLKRFKNMQLARMQDIGGLRAVVSTLKKVRQLELNYKKAPFNHELCGYYDYIENPKSSGYRSIHLVYKYRNLRVPEYNGLYIEIQIRTKLQHAWATAVETIGTYLNHSLKSSEGPEEWLRFFALVGSAFSYLEKTPPVPGYEGLSKEKTFKAVIEKTAELGVKDKLQAFSVATQHIKTDNKKGSYHLIVLDFEKRRVRIYNYSKENLKEANKTYGKIEREISKGKHLQTVLVSTGSIQSLRQAYPNYFLDTQEFVKQLDRIEVAAKKLNQVPSKKQRT